MMMEQPVDIRMGYGYTLRSLVERASNNDRVRADASSWRALPTNPRGTSGSNPRVLGAVVVYFINPCHIASESVEPAFWKRSKVIRLGGRVLQSPASTDERSFTRLIEKLRGLVNASGPSLKSGASAKPVVLAIWPWCIVLSHKLWSWVPAP